MPSCQWFSPHFSSWACKNKGLESLGSSGGLQCRRCMAHPATIAYNNCTATQTQHPERYTASSFRMQTLSPEWPQDPTASQTNHKVLKLVIFSPRLYSATALILKAKEGTEGTKKHRKDPISRVEKLKPETRALLVCECVLKAKKRSQEMQET